MLPEKSNSPDELKADIEVKKLLLEIQHGANFYEISKDIPPEIEQQWLDNILKFETMHEKADKILLYDFIDRPVFKKIEDIPSDEIKTELNRLLKQMNDKGVWLDVLAEYENKEYMLYKFITVELFTHEVEDLHMEGWNLNFIYEDFHPNHQYDITHRTEEFIGYLFNVKYPGDKRFDNFLFDVGDYIENESGDSDQSDKISPALTNFFNSLPERTLIDYELSRLEFNLLDTEDESRRGTATSSVCIQYAARTETGENINFTGTGKIFFELQWEWWQIVKVELPGLLLG